MQAELTFVGGFSCFCMKREGSKRKFNYLAGKNLMTTFWSATKAFVYQFGLYWLSEIKKKCSDQGVFYTIKL